MEEHRRSNVSLNTLIQSAWLVVIYLPSYVHLPRSRASILRQVLPQLFRTASHSPLAPFRRLL